MSDADTIPGTRTMFSSTLSAQLTGLAIAGDRVRSSSRGAASALGFDLRATAQSVAVAVIPEAELTDEMSIEPLDLVNGHRVLSEELFRTALVRERRRADRFDEVFALVTLRVPGLPVDAAGAMLAALAAAANETDSIGWVDGHEELGVILPDIGEFAGETTLRFEERVRQELEARLDPATVRRVEVRRYVHAGPGARGSVGLVEQDPLLAEIRLAQGRRVVADTVKRAIDLVGSLALLLVLSPLLLVVAILVKATSRGPILFRQERIGQLGKPFTMLKFRTMHAEADAALHQRFVTEFIRSSGQQRPADGTVVYKIVDDPRITVLGRILRRTSIDELPQLWNVLRGEMSLVGPRPPLRYEFDQYRSWHWRRVLEAKPGVTGLWQVAGRSRTTFDDMVRLDLRYVRTRSLWTDVEILLATPRAVLTRKGAC